MYEKECVICGKKIITNKRTKLCCGEECRRKRKCINTAKWIEKRKIIEESEKQKEKTKKEPNLDVDSRRAFELKISYGKYMALKNGYLIE